MNQLKKENSKIAKAAIAMVLVIAALSGIFFAMKGKNDTQELESSAARNEVADAKLSENGDLVIPVAEVSEKANFYEYDADGTKLEVIAVKANDGTIRTAFNTCQVCYSSGRGYYEQEGDSLVCQNCGNRFKASDVEVSKGGCNPVPIFAENKTVDETNITISKDFLNEAKAIFENWKS